MKKLLPYIFPFRFKITLQMIVKFAGTIFDLFIPWILSYIIDDVVPEKNKAGIYLWGFVMILCAVGAVILNISANRMAARISGDITKEIRHDLFSRTMRLSCLKIDEITEPSLISRLTSDTYYFYQMILRIQRLGIRAPILLVGGCIVTLMLEVKLAAVLIALLPILFLIVFYISKKGIPLYSKVQRAADKLVRRVREFMSGIRVILALSKRDYEKMRFSKANKRVVEAEQKAGYVMSATKPIMSFALNLGLALVILVGAFLVNKGETQPGKIIAFMTYFTIILNATLSITKIFVMVSKGTASADRIAKVLEIEDEHEYINEQEEEAEREEGEGEGEGEAEASNAHIEFRNVSFSYLGVSDNIRNISFKLAKGQSLGLIGATGSGKSTILLLLLRFYDSDKGEIFVDGRNIKSIPREELYKKFGTVFQNDILFKGSIGESIDFGRGVQLEEMNCAAKTARADFIYEKEGQFDYQLEIRGGNLSGGQKQRLLIARAMAKKPEILLLDDVSSALDYRTDAALRKSIEKDLVATTKIIVSQRASSVMKSDLILVLDKGTVIGKGSHDELLKNCPEYREIYDVQMGGAAV